MKALHAVDRATPRKKVVVRTFGVSLAALKRWLKRRREGEEYLRAKPSPGRTPRILSTLQQRRTLLTTTPGERRRYPTAFLEKGEPFRDRRPQHSISTTGLAPCASQPVGPSSLKTALVPPDSWLVDSAAHREYPRSV